jgi:Tfp pilus assembly protein PilX
MERARTSTDLRDERGIALFAAVMILLLISAIGLSMIDHSGEEAEVSGRSRLTATTFHAADGGVQILANRVTQNPPRTDPFDITLTDGNAMTPDVRVRSGTRTDTSAQPVAMVGTGPPPEGFAINIGSSYGVTLYRGNVTAIEPGSGTVELEGKFSKLEAGIGGYR